MLMCDRQESRPGEWLARKLMAPMEYLSPGTMTSPTSTVAKAVINTIVSPTTESFELFASKAIHRLTKPETQKSSKCPTEKDTEASGVADTQTPAETYTKTQEAAEP